MAAADEIKFANSKVHERLRQVFSQFLMTDFFFFL